MQKESREFLFKLLETPSVSGFEQKIQSLIKRRVSRYAHSVEVDVHGNLIAAHNPDGKIRVMLAGHCDQIGLMVTHVDDRGFLNFHAVGGIDPANLPGSRVSIHTADGIVPGVVGSKPVHLTPSAERGKKIELSKLWIDIGAVDGADARKRVAVGDPITFPLGVEKLGRHVIASAGCDDRVGAFVVMEALRLIAAETKGKRSHPVAVFAVSTVQEELGLRGARTACYGIDPRVGIAVDVTHASDNPGAEQKQLGRVALGDGPTIARGPNINPVLEARLVQTAKRSRLKHQIIAAPRATGTDANAMQISRAGVAAALIGIPNRYMHTPSELVDLRDVETAAKLIAKTVLSFTSRTSFIPV